MVGLFQIRNWNISHFYSTGQVFFENFTEKKN